MERLLGVPMGLVVAVVAGLFVFGVAALLATALRNRLLLTLALRNIPRRRMQSVLICVGLALGTVIVSTALNTGDTMSHTVRSLVAGTVGRADEVIVQPRRDARRFGFDGVQSVADGTFLTGTLNPFEQAEYDRLAKELAGEERIAGLAPAIVEQVVAVNLSTQELQAQVRLYALPRDYPAVFGRLEGPDGRATSFADTPSDGVVLNVEATAALNAAPGQTIRLYYREQPLELRVAEVVKSGELSGAQPTILVPLADFQAATEQVGSINQILVANRGDASTSVRLSEEVAGAIRPLLVDQAAAERLHALLSSDVGRAELGAALTNLEGRNRERVEALLRELDADEPTAAFKALISDPDIERRLFGVGARLAALQGRPGTNLLSTSGTLRVIETKRLSQELADRWGGALTSVFVVLGLFSIATGIMLVILIFVLLAAERRSELGVTRAIGAKRRHLALMFLYEGLAYDLMASAIGLALGVGIAVLLVRLSADMLAGFGIALATRVEPLSLVLAFCLGGVLTMLSIAFAAWRASRVTVVAAIRNLPEPPREDRGVRSILSGPLVAVLGVAVGGFGAARGWALPMGIGVALTVVGLVLAIRPSLGMLRLSRSGRDRLAFSIGGLGLLLYWLLPEEVLRSGGLRPLPRSMDVFFLAGLCLVLGAVWLVVFNLDALVAVIRRLWAPSRTATLVARVAFSYPVAERFRTGMAVAMFALVIFSMVVASVLLTGTHRAYSDPAVMAGGFDVRVDQTVGGAPDLREVLPGLETIKTGDLAAVAVQQTPPAEAIQPGAGVQAWRSIGLHLVDDRFTTTVRTGFTARAEGYGSDEAIWQALRENPGLAVIVGPAVRPRRAEPRGTSALRGTGFRIDGVAQEDSKLSPIPVWVRDTRGGRAVKLTVIGVLDPRASFGSGLFTSAATFAESGAPTAGRTVYLLKLAEGANPAEMALALNLALNDRGLRAGEIGEEVRRIQGVRMLLNDLLQGFIGVGLLAGIAGLGVISTRAVVERRQQIGVMRALGFTRRTVQVSFLLEASFVAALGIVVGVALGLGLSYRLVEFLGREFPEIIFSIPWGQIALLSACAYGAALLTTFLPAYQAGRVNPAQALRYE